MRIGIAGLKSCALLVVLALVLARPLPASTTSCEWSGINRVVAIGDIHGAYDRLVEILKVAGLSDAEGHWSGGAAHLVQLGDVLDRGADSRKAMDVLRRLEREAPAAGGMVHPLLGNHEAMRMMGDMRFTAAGEYEAFARADSESTRTAYLNTLGSARDRDQFERMPLGFLEMRLAFGRDGDYGRWLRQLPVTVTIDDFVFVHGGISAAFASLGCQVINDRMRRELTTDIDRTRANPLLSLAGMADGPLWYRGLALEGDGFASNVDDILARLHARAIVVGHSVATSGRITPRFGGRVIQIDTGMQSAYVPDGRAAALDIQGGNVTAIYVDGKEPVSVPAAAVTANGRSGNR